MPRARKRQHYANGQHVYCRLRDLNVPKKAARFLALAWEFVAHRIIYW